jgi:CheY-like chemotaxis protein
MTSQHAFPLLIWACDAQSELASAATLYCGIGDGNPKAAQASVDDAASEERRVRKILVIEDLALVQTLLRNLIEEPGLYEVCAVSDTEKGALADFETHQPDAVIVDLNLRQGSGLGFLHHMRNKGLLRRPILIVVTNHAIPILESACLKAGADYFLDKSRDLVRLRSVLDSAFNGLACQEAKAAKSLPEGGDMH